MKVAAAHGIADVVSDDELAEDYIVPSVFNRDVAREVAAAVAAEAERGDETDAVEQPTVERAPSPDARRRHRRDRHDRPRRRRALRERGDEVTALSRSTNWSDPKAAPPPLDALAGATASSTCSASTIAQRWSDDAKREIRDSRVLGTRNLVTRSGSCPRQPRPKVLVSQSAPATTARAATSRSTSRTRRATTSSPA